MSPLDDLRKRIDEIDSQMIALLNARARIAIEVGEIKKSRGMPIYAPEREDALLRSLMEKNDGPLSDPHLHAIFIEILSASRAVEEILEVACCVDACEATRERFGASTHYLVEPSLNKVMEAVSSGKAHLGILPFTNAEGRLQEETVSLLWSSSLFICTQFWRKPQQRFLAISRISPPPSGNDQTLVWMQIPSEQKDDDIFPNVLEEHILHRHALSKKASRPSENRYILVELSGHHNDPALQSAIALLRKTSQEVRILGSFPKGNA